MPATAERNYRRISLRLSKADIELIDRAAHLLGQSRSAFVREAALQAAEKVLSDEGEHTSKPEITTRKLRS